MSAVLLAPGGLILHPRVYAVHMAREVGDTVFIERVPHPRPDGGRWMARAGDRLVGWGGATVGWRWLPEGDMAGTTFPEPEDAAHAAAQAGVPR